MALSIGVFEMTAGEAQTAAIHNYTQEPRQDATQALRSEAKKTLGTATLCLEASQVSTAPDPRSALFMTAWVDTRSRTIFE